MSYFDYRFSMNPVLMDAPYYSLIMAAMRRADTPNTQKLKYTFPEIWAELEARYNAPGGLLDGETIPEW